jgi:hypothetical protein
MGWCESYVTSDPDGGGQMVPEMLIVSNQLTWLLVQEDFISVVHIYLKNSKPNPFRTEPKA